MRIGVAWESCPNAFYRAVYPLEAMARRGHEVVWPEKESGELEVDRLRECDLVHVYRRGTDNTRRALRELADAGTAITYDNDDDFTALPRQSPTYKKMGGLTGQRVFAETVKAAQMARRFVTTTEVLADKYRRAGVERVEVIGNYLTPPVPRPRFVHEGVVIGWIAGGEHRADADQIRIAPALERLLATHADVRVETIGINLGLRGRYRHDKWVDFTELPARIGFFDVGIAPLADLPWNRARSDIKLKEYAASGIPWLASPVGPYADLGEEQGGRLVADDEWFDALDELVGSRRDRRRLARKARRWAKRATIEAVADRWERVFAEAVS